MLSLTDNYQADVIDSQCPVALPHDVVGQSAVCDCGIF